MPWINLRGKDRKKNGGVNQAVVTKDGELLTLTTPFTQLNPTVRPFLNPTFGGGMNVNVAFSGNPDPIHNGEDSSLYTASTISGTKFTFDSSAHAHEGIVTVKIFGNLAGEIITVGLDGSDTVLTEGAQWTAETNEATTATNIATAISVIDGITATATGAIVSAIAGTGIDLTTLSTNSASDDMTATGQSVETDNGAVGDTIQFAKGSDLTLANFTALTLQIFVDKNWAAGDSIQFYAFDTGLGVEVGVRVNLEDFFNFAGFDTWQAVIIPLTAMDIETDTTVDAFRITIAAKVAPSPTFYIDQVQVEQSGTPAEFKVAPQTAVEEFHITELRFSIADAQASTLANNSMPALAFDKILNVNSLANGILFRRIQNGLVQFTVQLQQLGDFLAAGADIVNPMSDNTNTFIGLLILFPEPVILKGSPTQNFLSFTINDDLSGLDQFTVVARGSLVVPR